MEVSVGKPTGGVSVGMTVGVGSASVGASVGGIGVLVSVGDSAVWVEVGMIGVGEGCATWVGQALLCGLGVWVGASVGFNVGVTGV